MVGKKKKNTGPKKQWIHLASAHLDELLAEATVDCYDEYEELS